MNVVDMVYLVTVQCDCTRRTLEMSMNSVIFEDSLTNRTKRLKKRVLRVTVVVLSKMFFFLGGGGETLYHCIISHIIDEI